MLFTGKYVVPPIAALYVAGIVFKNQDMTDANITWACKQPEPNPYQMEWDDLIAAIRDVYAAEQTKSPI